MDRTNISSYTMDTFLLIAILSLLVLIVGYFIISQLIHRREISEEDDYSEIAPTEQLIKLIPSLQKEMAEIQGKKEKLKDYNKLKNKIELLKKENQTFSDEKTALTNKTGELERKLQIKAKEVDEYNKSNAELLGKVKKADILKDYASKVIDYLDFCEDILKETSKEVESTDIEITQIMSALLQQAFQKTTELAKWKQICSDIKENGIAIQNKDLRNCFQYDKESEHLIAFRKLLISRIKPITNALLILCEANSNLSKFLESSDVSSIENEFSNRITEIKRKVKEIGINEIADVKLFNRLNNSEAIDGSVLFPYKIVKNLNKDDVVEIIEFGMKTEFDEALRTKVLIY